MASTYLAQKISGSSGEEAALWGELETLFSRKLWHQLTVKLGEAVRHPSLASGGLVELYESFIKEFSDRINQLEYVRLALVVTSEITDPAAAIAFLEGVKEKCADDRDATVRVTTAIAALHTQTGDLETVQKLLDACEAQLDEVDGVSPMHAHFYKAQSDYHKLQGNFDGYYTSALRYLGCIEPADLSADEAAVRAFDLGLAALLGKTVFNFGELLAHAVLEALKDTEKQWLVDLLFAFNSGDLAAFEALKPAWQAQNDLAASGGALLEKIQLLSLMEMVFKAPAHSRSLSFSSIAGTARLDQDKVEHLVMRALSLGLVKGSIDQVESTANLHWVQPRVLDIKQLAAMKAKMDSWVAVVDQTAAMVQGTSPEIFDQQF